MSVSINYDSSRFFRRKTRLRLGDYSTILTEPFCEWLLNMSNIATIVRALWLAAKRANFFFVMTMLGNLIVDLPCYGQLAAVKKGLPLISVTWLYRGLKCKAHWGDVFSTGQLLVLIDHRLRSKNSHKLSKKLCLVVSISSPGSFRFEI